MTYTKEDLIAWYEDLYRSLIDCDPSASADSLDTFIDIQEEQECFVAACLRAGYTEDEIIDASY